MENTNDQAPPAGYGHTVEIKLSNGKTASVPWGFSDAKKEVSAAKKHKLEDPGTAAKQADDTESSE